MDIGTQVYAPQGFGSIAKGETLHFLANTNDPRRTLLVRLWDRPHKMKGGGVRSIQGADIVAMPGAVFDDAVEKGLIAPRPDQIKVPPWLREFQPHELKTKLEEKPEIAERIKALISKVKSASDDFRTIVASRNPHASINQSARKHNLNTARYRLAFCVYHLFGEKPENLISLKFKCGRHNRESLPVGSRKLGRTSRRHGKGFGSNLRAEEKDVIEAFYRKNATLGVKKIELYRRCMRESFRCVATGAKKKTLVHPEGLPFPTPRQFYSVVNKRIGLRETQVIRFGFERVRNLLVGSKGQFTENLCDLMEAVEGDGYTVSEHPTGIDGTTLPKLTVVRIIDSVSRMRVGIGFSFNGERAAAYLMAIVCMAMDKVRFCALFGLSIRPEEWPSQGWPSREIFDRGPGATIDIEEIAFQELTPSNAGQSKAIAESAHRKEDNTSGPPSYLQTSQSAIQLAVGEIQKLLFENATVAVERPPRMVAAGVMPTPNGVWEYLSRLGRKCGPSVDESDAIPLLPTVEVTCDKNGVKFYGEVFTSEALKRSGILDQAARENTITLTAHIMPMCIRQFWIKWKNQFIEVTWALPFEDGDEQTYLTLQEMERLDRKKKDDAAELGDHQDAVAVEMAQRYEDTFGRPLKRSVRRRGRAKARSPAARAETRAVQKVAEGAK